MDVNQYAEYTKRKQSVLDQINESVAIEMKDAGSTAWALLNGITRYTNHMANFASKDDYIYADTGMFMNNRAQVHALKLLNEQIKGRSILHLKFFMITYLLRKEIKKEPIVLGITLFLDFAVVSILLHPVL